MKVKYDSDADVLVFVVRDAPPVDSIEEAGGIIVSYGKDGEPVTVEFLNASIRKLIKSGEINISLQGYTAIIE